MLKFHCPKCRAKLLFQQIAPGERFKCLACGEIMFAPDHSQITQALPPELPDAELPRGPRPLGLAVIAWIVVVGASIEGTAEGLIVLASFAHGTPLIRLGIICLAFIPIGMGLLEGDYRAWIAIQWTWGAAIALSLLDAVIIAAPLALLAIIPASLLIYIRAKPVRNFCSKNRTRDVFTA
jgi:hypothetical protein